MHCESVSVKYSFYSIVALVRVRVRYRTGCAHRRTGFWPGAAQIVKKAKGHCIAAESITHVGIHIIAVMTVYCDHIWSFNTEALVF